jgi:hypothetical protein
VPWTLFVLTPHAVGSTTVPIVMVELCTPARRATPWVRRPGLVVAAALFVVGLAANAAFQLAIDPFVAAPAQLVGAAAAAGALFTYAWHAFPGQPVLPTSSAVDLAGNAIFALGAVLLIEMAWRRTAVASTIVLSSADR